MKVRATDHYAKGDFKSLEHTNYYEPITANLPQQFESHILGAQGNLWTEYIPNLHYAEYMIFPRLTALAEATWSPKSAHDLDNFSRRLQIEFQRFDQLGINYRHMPANAPEAVQAK